MKKIPTLFKRDFDENGNVVGITDEITEGMEWVLRGEGDATIKYDGACCAYFDGVMYKRYDAKRGKTPPKGAIPCCEADPITGHHPHWVKISEDNPSDKWFLEAFDRSGVSKSGTYEAVGKHFNGNPYAMDYDILVRHGEAVINGLTDRSFENIKRWLNDNYVEGIVFWKDGEPQCKIKRTDFGFSWNKKENKRD